MDNMFNKFIIDKLKLEREKLDLLGYEAAKKTLETGYEHGIQETGTIASRGYKIIKTDKKLTKERFCILKRVVKEFEEGVREWKDI